MTATLKIKSVNSNLFVHKSAEQALVATHLAPHPSVEGPPQGAHAPPSRPRRATAGVPCSAALCVNPFISEQLPVSGVAATRPTHCPPKITISSCGLPSYALYWILTWDATLPEFNERDMGECFDQLIGCFRLFSMQNFYLNLWVEESFSLTSHVEGCFAKPPSCLYHGVRGGGGDRVHHGPPYSTPNRSKHFIAFRFQRWNF